MQIITMSIHDLISMHAYWAAWLYANEAYNYAGAVSEPRNPCSRGSLLTGCGRVSGCGLCGGRGPGGQGVT